MTATLRMFNSSFFLVFSYENSILGDFLERLYGNLKLAS